MKLETLQHAWDTFTNSPFFTGAAGALTSLLLPGSKKTFKMSIAYIIVGMMVAGYGAPFLLEWLGIESSNTANAVVFFIGLVGVALAGGLMALGKAFKEDPAGTLKNIRNIWKR